MNFNVIIYLLFFRCLIPRFSIWELCMNGFVPCSRIIYVLICCNSKTFLTLAGHHAGDNGQLTY